MTPFFIDLIRVNGLQGVSYAEPYAGGAGTAINLLLDGQVRRIYINDANIAIFSFWKYAINESERFIDKIEKTCIDLQNWQYYHNFIKNTQQPSFELGFAAFFLSRTNRSGILTAGPIGGKSQEKQEKATYKIDCRFNKQDLISRIHRISMYKENIVVSNDDAIDFLKSLPADNNNLVYLDPPYFKQGKSLYLNYYSADDHRVLSDYLYNTVINCTSPIIQYAKGGVRPCFPSPASAWRTEAPSTSRSSAIWSRASRPEPSGTETGFPPDGCSPPSWGSTPTPCRRPAVCWRRRGSSPPARGPRANLPWTRRLWPPSAPA